MKSIARTAGLCLVAMITMGMALAGSASAAPLWLLCLEGSASTSKYSSGQCTKTEAGGKWESVALGSKSDTVRIVGLTLRLTDLKTSVGKSTIKCDGVESEGEGYIYTEKHGIINTAEVKNAKTNCERVEGGCKAGEVEKVKGADLPWLTELFETEGKFLTKIGGTGKGEPGWEITCKTLEGSKTDVCLSESTEKREGVELTNKVSTSGVLLVLGTFEKARKAKCSLGTAESGEVEGQIAILLNSGNGLSINKE
jgi:hypothetical protein